MILPKHLYRTGNYVPDLVKAKRAFLIVIQLIFGIPSSFCLTFELQEVNAGLCLYELWTGSFEPFDMSVGEFYACDDHDDPNAINWAAGDHTRESAFWYAKMVGELSLLPVKRPSTCCTTY